MSGFTPLPLTHFRKALRARGSSVESLADEIERGRSHVSQVLWGHRDGGDTWARIRASVTRHEWELLLQMEHCATWNNAQLAHGPESLVWLMRVECAGVHREPCGKLLHFTHCEAAQTGEVSHGQCPTCYAKTIAQIRALRGVPQLEELASV